MTTVGIDLGTTFSSIATMDSDGKPYIISNEYNERTTPSVVFFDGDTPIIGRDACTEEALEPKQAIRLIKRHMGDRDFFFALNSKEYSATQLSSFILDYLISQAQSHLGKKITQAVITVPAYFLDEERIATKKSGELAGVEVLRLVNEPTAAAVAYGYSHPQNLHRVLTFDLGGGTFDLTLLEMKNKEFNIVASIGEPHLGGADWDDVLMNLIAEEFLSRKEIDLREISGYLPVLRNKAIYAKHSLTQRNKVSIEISHAKDKEKIDIVRHQFEEATTSLLEQTEMKLLQLLKQTQTKVEDIDAVLMVGGATRMPMVHKMVEKILKKKPLTGIAAEEAVALGAAIMAYLETQKSSGLMVFPQASGIKVQDVTAHSLGMVVLNKDGERRNSIIIPQFTPVPAEHTKDNFVTSFDGQTQLELQVVQGEDRDPQNCEVLASYRFSGIPSRPRGESHISISFCYDKNSIIEVNATDVATGTRLSKENIGEIEGESAWPSYIFLLLDCSRSMTRVLNKAKKAAIDFIHKTCGSMRRSSATGLSVLLKSSSTGISKSSATGLTLATNQKNLGNAYCGLITFGGRDGYHLEHSLSDDPYSLVQTIEAIHTAQGETYMASALGLAGKELTSQPPGHKTIVLVTDGCPKDMDMTLRNAQRAKEHKIRLITIGLGKHANRTFLKEISSGSSYYSEHYTGITKIFANLLLEI